MKTKISIASLALLFASAASSNAAIVLSGNFNTGTTTPKLTITQDITFTITNGANFGFLVFDNWAISDTTSTAVLTSPSQTFAYSRDGFNGTVNLAGLIDNNAGLNGSISADDGILFFNTIIGSPVGSQFTVKAGSYTFGSNAAFNPLLSTTNAQFIGNVFLSTGGGVRVSNVVAVVPEPSALLLCGLGSLAFLRRKR